MHSFLAGCKQTACHVKIVTCGTHIASDKRCVIGFCNTPHVDACDVMSNKAHLIERIEEAKRMHKEGRTKVSLDRLSYIEKFDTRLQWAVPTTCAYQWCQTSDIPKVVALEPMLNPMLKTVRKQWRTMQQWNQNVLVACRAAGEDEDSEKLAFYQRRSTANEDDFPDDFPGCEDCHSHAMARQVLEAEKKDLSREL